MAYLISLAAGLAVGFLYWLFKVQSPAPPLIALIGLLGMVVGEHAIPIVKTYVWPTSSMSPTLMPQSKNTTDATDHPHVKHPVHLMAKTKFTKDKTQRSA